MKQFHIIAINCKTCNTRWKINIPLSGNKIEVFATICNCGAIIVGNYNRSLDLLIDREKSIKLDKKKQKYLTNGHFEVIELPPEELSKLPILELE